MYRNAARSWGSCGNGGGSEANAERVNSSGRYTHNNTYRPIDNIYYIDIVVRDKCYSLKGLHWRFCPAVCRGTTLSGQKGITKGASRN